MGSETCGAGAPLESTHPDPVLKRLAKIWPKTVEIAVRLVLWLLISKIYILDG